MVRGEGEATFAELCNAILNQTSLSNVEGISYPDGEHVIMNPNRSFMNLKELPVLARELYPLEKIYDLNGSVDACADVRAAWVCPLRACPCDQNGNQTIIFLSLANNAIQQIPKPLHGFGSADAWRLV